MDQVYRHLITVKFRLFILETFVWNIECHSIWFDWRCKRVCKSMMLYMLYMISWLRFLICFREVILNILIVVVGTLKIVKIQGRLMGGRLNSHDQFRDWRLDIDNMSYEVSSFSSIMFWLYHQPIYSVCVLHLHFVLIKTCVVFNSNCLSWVRKLGMWTRELKKMRWNSI